jgi:hypothetical protein
MGSPISCESGLQPRRLMKNSKIFVMVIPTKSRVPREESSDFSHFWTPTFVGVTD